MSYVSNNTTLKTTFIDPQLLTTGFESYKAVLHVHIHTCAPCEYCKKYSEYYVNKSTPWNDPSALKVCSNHNAVVHLRKTITNPFHVRLAQRPLCSFAAEPFKASHAQKCFWFSVIAQSQQSVGKDKDIVVGTMLISRLGHKKKSIVFVRRLGGPGSSKMTLLYCTRRGGFLWHHYREKIWLTLKQWFWFLRR